MLLTGCRRSEATNLTWDQVDLVGGKVTFRDTKARRDHVIPLGPYLWEVLKRRRETAGAPWVFSERTTTDRRRQNERFENVRYALGRMQKASGVTFTLHYLRRTFATVAESLDLSSYAVKALPNHALPREDVTAGYLRLRPERLQDGMEKVERRRARRFPDLAALAGLAGPHDHSTGATPPDPKPLLSSAPFRRV